MAIKHLSSISEKDLAYFENHPVYIIEKMDMIFIKVSVGIDSVVLLKPPFFTPVDGIDRTVNVMYSEIEDTLCKAIYDRIDDVTHKYGKCVIGFFYLPVSKARHIDYYTVSKPTFYVSDVYIDDSEIKREYPDSQKLVVDMASILGMKSAVALKCENNARLVSVIRSYIDGKTSERDMAMSITAGCSLPSKLPVYESEGLIIRSGKRAYQVIINDTATNIDKNMKKPYRDIILRDFINVMLDGSFDLDKLPDNYIDAVSSVFVSYMDRTDVFKKYAFDPDDLEPPHEGYMGGMDIDRISDDTAKFICRFKPVAKAVLRMFLHTFRNPVNADKAEGFSREESSALSAFTEKMSSRTAIKKIIA